MFSVGLFRVCRPLVRAIELLNEPLGEQSLEIAYQDDVVLSVEVDPAVVAFLRMVALYLTSLDAVEDVIKRLPVDVSKNGSEVLA